MVNRGRNITTAKGRTAFAKKYMSSQAFKRYTRPGQLGRTQFGRAGREGMHIDRAELLKHLTDTKKYVRGPASMKRYRQMLFDAKRPYRRGATLRGLQRGTPKPKYMKPKGGIKLGILGF